MVFYSENCSDLMPEKLFLGLRKTFENLRLQVEDLQKVEIIRTIYSTIFETDYFFSFLKFIYSQKATKFCEIFPLLLTTVHTQK